MEIFEKFTSFFDVEKKKELDEARRVRGIHAKHFLESEFFQKHLLPFIDSERMGGYPKPDEKGWEEKYRTAFAKDEVYSKLISTVQSWVKEGESLPDEDAPVKDIVNA